MRRNARGIRRKQSIRKAKHKRYIAEVVYGWEDG